MQFEKRRRRSQIPAQGWSASDNPGIGLREGLNPERVRQLPNPFRVGPEDIDLNPGFSLRSNPELELVNAFGVLNRFSNCIT
jgi:hypothetical protein